MQIYKQKTFVFVQNTVKSKYIKDQYVS